MPSPAPYGTTAALSHDGKRYYAPIYSGVGIYDVGPPPQIDNSQPPAGPPSPLIVVISPDGTTLLAAGAQTAQFTTLATNQTSGPPSLPAGTSYIGGAFHPDGTTAYLLSVAAADGTKTLTAFDVPTNTVTGSITYGANTPAWCCGIAVTSDGAYVLCGDQNAVQVVQTAPLQLAGTLPATGLGPTTDIRLTSDGTTAVVCSCTAHAIATTQLPHISGGVAAVGAR